MQIVFCSALVLQDLQEMQIRLVDFQLKLSIGQRRLRDILCFEGHIRRSLSSVPFSFFD